MVLGTRVPGRVGRRRVLSKEPSLGAALSRSDTASLARVRTPRTSRRERLPCGRATAPLVTGPVREAARLLGPRLQAVLAQGGEVDREVDRAQDPLGNARVAVVSQSHAGEARNGLGQNIRS